MLELMYAQSDFCIKIPFLLGAAIASIVNDVSGKAKKQIYNINKTKHMEVFFAPQETLFLEFKLTNGSGWLTSQRLIMVEHEPGKLKEGKRKDYPLEYFEDAQIKETTLTAQFKTGKVKIQLQTHFPSLLQEIKEYIEESAKQCKKQLSSI